VNAIIWLEKYLQNWPNTLVVVSHDRDFLDEVATDIVHMHNERLDAYRGAYSNFIQTRQERRRNQLKEYEAQLQYRQHLQDFIDRWRYNAKRAAQAQSKIKILEKLPELKPPEDDGVEDNEGKFRWPDPTDKLSPPILQADDITFSYTPDGKRILDNVSFSVGLDSRVALVGANGSGKSTLLKLLIGQLQPSKGLVQRHARLRYSYFSQHHVDALEDEDGRMSSALEFLQKKFPGKTEEEYRGVLGRFGISGNTAIQPMRTLSGGQKSRVVFAMMALNNPHILIL
jgi:ATP-binding cassette subfamily F protein 3